MPQRKADGVPLFNEMPLATAHHIWDKRLYNYIIAQSDMFFKNKQNARVKTGTQ